MLTREQKTRIYEVYNRDVWSGNAHMSDYCTKKISTIAVLPNGDFIPVDKQSIQKNFCFGYSDSRYDTSDYDRANAMARYASESVEDFKEQNMESFKQTLKTLKSQLDDDLPREMCVIRLAPYIGQPEASPLKEISFTTCWQIIDAHGGECYMSEVIGGEAFYLSGQLVRVPSKDELKIIISAYEHAAREHEKRIDTYLKKYGLTKVNTWSYWRDE